MKVRLRTSMWWGGELRHDGDEIDLPDDSARKYIAAGSAEPITISFPPVETAALITQPPKGRANVRHAQSRS